jgi:hypothetical protein
MWQIGPVTHQLEGITPLVAQWEKNTHPAQVRLTAYLQHITSSLSTIPPPPAPLFLQLHVRVDNPHRLLHQYDVENFLTPLFGPTRLDTSRFYLVIGTKDTSTPSHISVGIASSDSAPSQLASWAHCTVQTTSSTSSKEWKESLRQALEKVAPAPLRDGPISAQIHFRCSTTRNWSQLWKPAGDAMGPVLGYINATQLYHPKDDRLVRIEFHKQVDDTMGHSVQVNYYWNALRT